MKIHDRALLVRLGIGMPGNSRKDREITDEVKANHRLGEKAGKWLKLLYPTEALEPISKLATEARTFHYENTLPWKDDGQRILPSAHHAEYSRKLREFRQKFEQLSQSHFLDRLQHWEDEAKLMHNGTFRAEDYKAEHKLRKKFKFDTDFEPVPSSNDFRVDVDDSIKDALDAKVAEAAEASQRDLWSRLSAPLKAMSQRLKEADPIFRDTLVGNLKDIAALVPKLNLTDDPALSGFAAEVEQAFAATLPKALREDHVARTEAKAKADDILSRMSGYLAPATTEDND